LPRYDVPGHDQLDGSPSSNLQPGQIYQAPAPMARQSVPNLVSEAIKHDY
jgi:hypothetical protein